VSEGRPSLEKEKQAVPETEASPTIIIDPGHGGKDPGAISRKKIKEKDVVLSISKKLADSLRKKMGADVFLTRNGDQFISLGGRDTFANGKSCDFFISIHANASRNEKLDGIEVYYLNRATDQASRRLASRENEGAPKKEKEIEGIVSDLLQAASTEESAQLASVVAKNIRKEVSDAKGVQVKTALFYVLVGAKCPSLLVETGFITNKKEGKRLKSSRYQKELADGIANGVQKYLLEQKEKGSDL
jgi:N-acetylmuramoyl-L-alanine amidase